jgi:hypothetical protein
MKILMIKYKLALFCTFFMSVDSEDQEQPTANDTVTDVLKHPSGTQVIKYVTGVFGFIGVGIGFTGLLANGLLGSRVGVAGGFALTISFFSGTIVAAMLTLAGTFDLEYDLKDTYVLSFSSTAVGYVVMTLFSIIIISITSGLRVGRLLIGSVLLSIPTGTTALLLIWLRQSTELQPTID